MKPTSQAGIIRFSRALSAFSLNILSGKKKRRDVGLSRSHLRLLNTITAAKAIMTTTALPIAMYVAVGAGLVGGWTASVGEGETGCAVGFAVPTAIPVSPVEL